ncbi:DUF362 domain-containing protein [Natrinema halophilum]|uniref:DUF362 domain-containing protein n=1 Tax=Natrinema halophilum TaxID=1699371 RepID=A0A7D5KX58_9EURY|nr:DUF362 domain-containing protein [Natrinema halophilum]QLG48562.1 DUF362 domain-containing protein [Natrinema halophilum]
MSGARVRAVTVDEPDHHGSWVPDVDARIAGLEAPVRGLLEPTLESFSSADRITLVPDVHYPFHPSSGMITDPAVIGTIVGHLERCTDADVAVAGASTDRMSFDRTAAYLGYTDVLEGFEADLVDLADEPHTEHVQPVDGRSVSLTVPNRLDEDTVIVVPSLRPTENGTVAGAMRTLASLVLDAADADRVPVAVTRLVEPETAVVDATTVYGGEPAAANTLFSGAVSAVDAVASSLLGRSPADDGALETVRGDEAEPITVEGTGIDFDRLRARIPDGDLPPADETHPAVSTAYRMYATVAGDAVPPQLEGGR